MLFPLLLVTYVADRVFSQNLNVSANANIETKLSLSQANVTRILDDLLSGYDKRLRPNHYGPPTIVKVDINIRSMGPVSEQDMSYSLDAYFRQTWLDDRLGFNSNFQQSLALSSKMLDRIWKPDTYFVNGRGSYIHPLTVPNKLIRLNSDGSILYSMRLTIKATCPMYLRYFPVDVQICPLSFGSYGYSDSDIIYQWKYGSGQSVEISKDVKLSQFDLTSHASNNLTLKDKRGSFSVLTTRFHLKRHMGFFLIQVYVPCTLLVILSWVSFLINREATADRVGLGVTTVLTLTTLSMDSRQDLPRVSYATALDWFIVMCNFFVIASLFEFAGVHYFTKFGSGEIDHESDSESEESEEDQPSSGSRHSQIGRRGVYPAQEPITKMGTSGCLREFMKCLQGNAKYRKVLAKRARRRGINSVSVIDKISRFLFPFAFGSFHLFYWLTYIKTDQAAYRYHHS